MASTRNGNTNQSPTNESKADNLSSLSELEVELSEYLVQNESTAYHELYPGVEMINYDFTVERQNIYSTNLIESIAHLIKGCLGAGVLGMHEAYMNGGLWTSLAVTVVIGFLVSYCMLMLVGSAQTMYGRLRVARLSYPDLAEVALATGPFKFCRKLSKVFRYTVDTFIFLDFMGTCCIFEIMIAETLEKVVIDFGMFHIGSGRLPCHVQNNVLKSVTNWEFTTSHYILIITLPLMSLCLIRSLKYLAPFSIFADLVIGICVITTMYYSISIATSLSDRRSWNNVHGFFRFLGVYIYSINGIGVTLPIENNMRNPQDFRIVVQCAMPIVISFLAIIGFFGYWAWGDQCQSPITSHMPANSTFRVMQGVLAVTLGVTFALNFWVSFRIIWRYIGKRYKTNKSVCERIYRGIHVLVISGLSLALPNMVTWMSFVGNFFTAFLLLIFPALIDILVKWKEPRRNTFRLSILKDISLISVGIILCGGAFYHA